jgi:ribonuclease E
VQIGKISQFGLLEMSRQRLRAGGHRRFHRHLPALRRHRLGALHRIHRPARVARLEEEGEKNRAAAVTVKIANDVAIYILNQKRHELSRIEPKHGMEISFVAQGRPCRRHLRTGTHQEPRSGRASAQFRVSIEAGFVPSTEPEPDYVGRVWTEEERRERGASLPKRGESRNPGRSTGPEAPAREPAKVAAAAAAAAGAAGNRDRNEGQAPQPIEAAEAAFRGLAKIRPIARGQPAQIAMARIWPIPVSHMASKRPAGGREWRTRAAAAAGAAAGAGRPRARRQRRRWNITDRLCTKQTLRRGARRDRHHPPTTSMRPRRRAVWTPTDDIPDTTPVR